MQKIVLLSADICRASIIGPICLRWKESDKKRGAQFIVRVNNFHYEPIKLTWTLVFIQFSWKKPMISRKTDIFCKKRFIGLFCPLKSKFGFQKCHNIALSSGRGNAQGKYSKITGPKEESWEANRRSRPWASESQKKRTYWDYLDQYRLFKLLHVLVSPPIAPYNRRDC